MPIEKYCKFLVYTFKILRLKSVFLKCFTLQQNSIFDATMCQRFYFLNLLRKPHIQHLKNLKACL